MNIETVYGNKSIVKIPEGKEALQMCFVVSRTKT